MSKYRVWILLVLCNLFWAGNYVFGKYMVTEMTPLAITFSRWTVASCILFSIAYFMEKPQWSRVMKMWPWLVMMGVLGIIGYNLVLYSALDYTSATNASLISALNPGMMVLFSIILLREKISRLQASGILVSLIGVFVILTKGNLAKILHTQYNKGDLLMLAAIVLWTAYSILGKRLTAIPPITATAVSSLFATLIMAPFAIQKGINITDISPLAVTGILYIIVFPSVGSFIFWNISVREIGASQAGIFLNLIPVFTALISWILGEKITPAQGVGGMLVFLGVYLTTGMLDRRLERVKKVEI